MSARKGPKRHLDSPEVLRAIAVLGIRWTVAFRNEEITAVNEALDRELLNGNLVNAYTLSSQGEHALRTAAPQGARGRLDIRVDASCLQCRLADECWTITCVRCGEVELRHVPEGELADVIQHVIASHDCLASSDDLRADLVGALSHSA